MPDSDTSVGDSTTNKALEIVSITATDESTATMKSGLQLKRLTSLRNDVDVTTLDYCQRNKKDDWYLQALKVYYFPFLLKNHNYICIVWLCVFIISLVFGPALLSLTRTNLDVPAGTPTATALSVFKSHFPAFSTFPPAFIVARSDKNSLIGNATRTIGTDLQRLVSEHPNVIEYMTDYYNYIGDPDRAFLAPTSLSANNLTMVYGIHFKAGADPNDIVDTVYKLLSFAADQSYPYIHVGCTGLQALFNELTDGSKLAFELIDAVVLPIAIAILGFNLRSYRHMLVAIVNLGCTLLLALAILVPVAKATYFNPFAPSIFLTLGISICFDYSLFLLSRFREEMIVNGKSKEEAVFCCLEASGHVIMLSGTTIFFTFVLLIAFPQNILQSVGYGCGVIIFTAILANMTIGPSLLLTFNCLSKFDAVPNFRSCCCCLYKRTNSDPKVETNVTDTEAKEEKSLQTPKKDGLFTKTVDSADDHDEYFKRPETHDTAQEESQLAMKSVKTSDRPLTGPEAVKCPRQFWFRISYFVTRRSYITLLVAIGITIPFALEFSKMRASSDNNLVFWRTSESLKYLKILASSFSIGAIDPYQVVVTTGVPGAVNTQAYFDAERHLLQTIFDGQLEPYVAKKSIVSMSYFNGLEVNFASSQAYFNANSTSYNTTYASQYRTTIENLWNTDKSAFLIVMETSVDPDSENVVPFIKGMRALLIEQSKTPFVPTLPVGLYLLGGFCGTLDIQRILYDLYPIMIASTIGVVLLIVGLSFASVGLPIRLALTIAISLSWTYGLLALVYQPGPGQDAFSKLNPELTTSTGVYYLIPIMSFSILVGLAMDYDIFLMFRVLEFRRMGWSNRAAVCLAVEKTGNIITAAGLIMSISFAGLLIPATTVLNQFGFVLFIGVAIDTFIVRTCLVPAAVTAFTLQGCGIRITKSGLTFGSRKQLNPDQEAGMALYPHLNHEEDDGEQMSVWRFKDVDANWWPNLMPRVVLSEVGEDEALWAGYDSPHFYLREMKGAETDVKSTTDGPSSM